MHKNMYAKPKKKKSGKKLLNFLFDSVDVTSIFLFDTKIALSFNNKT